MNHDKDTLEIAEQILALLPKRDCGRCGFENCEQLALAISRREAIPHICRKLGREQAERIAAILQYQTG